MNIGAAHPGRRLGAAVRRDSERIAAIRASCRARHKGEGDMLFGAVTIADAFYAPVVMRCATYAVELSGAARVYADAVRALPAVREWMAQACRETAFVAADEPYAETEGTRR